MYFKHLKAAQNKFRWTLHHRQIKKTAAKQNASSDQKFPVHLFCWSPALPQFLPSFLPLFILLFIHSFIYLFICTHHLHINTYLHQHHSPQQWLRLFSQGNIITECDCGWFSWTVCVSALTQYSVFRSFCSTHIKVSLLFYSCRIHKWKWWLAQTHVHVPTSEVECEALAVAHELSGRRSYVVFFF